MKLIKNIVQAELSRPRNDGYTTKLRKLAKSLGYKFVVHHKDLAQPDDMLLSQDLRGLQTGFIFDHHAIYIACASAEVEITKLQLENRELQKDFQDCYGDYQDLGRTMSIECGKYESKINKLKKQIDKLKRKKK